MEEEGWIIDNSLSDEERRAYERYSANFYLCIHEQQSGELLGHKIEIVGEDTGCSPEGGQAAAEGDVDGPLQPVFKCGINGGEAFRCQHQHCDAKAT